VIEQKGLFGALLSDPEAHFGMARHPESNSLVANLPTSRQLEDEDIYSERREYSLFL
jgi:hypothetical protein